MENVDRLTLKWGTLKSWNVVSDRMKELMERYIELGSSYSAMCQDDSPEQKELICKMIDHVPSKKIYLEWDGREVSKEEAKKYVIEYGKNKCKKAHNF